jgi:hypothetical protein
LVIAWDIDFHQEYISTDIISRLSLGVSALGIFVALWDIFAVT